MKKKEYIDAINEIKADEDLKTKTLSKITKKRNFKIMYSVAATFVIALVIGVSAIMPMRNNRNKSSIVEIEEQESVLPKINNFENLCNIIKTSYNNSHYALYENEINLSDSASEWTAQKELDYSRTNLQVEGVEEADIVKTDGDYIYYISYNKVVIVDAKNSSDLKILYELKYNEEDFSPDDLYLYGDKLIVIGQKINNDYNRFVSVDRLYPEEAYTLAKVYNIQNRNNPIMEREIKVEGSYLSSRMIGENIYFITNKYIYSYLFKDELDKLDPEMFKPKYTDTVIGTEEKCIEYDDIYYFPESEDTSYLNIVGFNVNNNEQANIETYLGAGNEIYSSENNLYITREKYDYKDDKTYNNYDLNTQIYKFELKNSKVIYKCEGSVPGDVLNQFSMDEKDGYFRIATTDSESWNSETNTNNLYVLNENLEIVGKIENLAKGEKIYSVRFIGNRAYMVTFVQTDPLFVIDLSNPKEPTVLGELKIPGYSNYLHPYDENHIIGFGENTKTNKSGGVVIDGMKMALFDVSDPNSPKELYSVNIGEAGTYSEILYNHKALLFSKEKNIIAFPISISEDVSSYRNKLKFQGAIVYGLDLENGFTLKGKIVHMEIKNSYKDYNPTLDVERIIYIKDSLYTLSEGLIKSSNINTMEEEGKIEIEVDDYNKYYGYIE